jgi:hypothetical protein
MPNKYINIKTKTDTFTITVSRKLTKIELAKLIATITKLLEENLQK